MTPNFHIISIEGCKLFKTRIFFQIFKTVRAAPLLRHKIPKKWVRGNLFQFRESWQRRGLPFIKKKDYDFSILLLGIYGIPMFAKSTPNDANEARDIALARQKKYLIFGYILFLVSGRTRWSWQQLNLFLNKIRQINKVWLPFYKHESATSFEDANNFVKYLKLCWVLSGIGGKLLHFCTQLPHSYVSWIVTIPERCFVNRKTKY